MNIFLWLLLYFVIGFVSALIYAKTQDGIRNTLDIAHDCVSWLIFWPVLSILLILHGIDLFFYWLVKRM